MKQRKKNTEKINNTDLLRPSRALRRQEKLENEKRNNEKSRNALFRKRVREASEKKAPKTLRTKAYYRFSSEYPSELSPDGFRENKTEKSSMSPKKRIFTALACVLVFFLSLLTVQTAAEISKRSSEEEYTAPADTASASLSFYHVRPDDLSSKTAEELISEIKATGCNTAVLEFKDEYGYVYFNINSFVGSSADKKISTAWDTLNSLNGAGISTAAYISCFKDTVAASSLSGMETKTSSGSIFKDKENACWLDPFSGDACTYVLDVIKKASEGGFSYVLLDNVCYPYDYSSSAPAYGLSAGAAEKNSALISFINSAAAAVGKEKIITLCDISGFAALSQIPNEKYGGTITDSSCIAYCVDLRKEKQYSVQLDNCEVFNYIEEMPLAFILDAGALAKNRLLKDKEASVIFAIIDKNTEDAAEFSVHAGIDNIIYW